MSAQWLQRIADSHALLRAMGRSLDDKDYRSQYHVDLSPPGWHVGHCVFVESYWLREIVLGDNSLTSKLDWLYVPTNLEKPKRGPALPPIDEHLQWCEDIVNENRALVEHAGSEFSDHPLNRDDYLLRFLLQHHAQHCETMAMVLAQRRLQLADSRFEPTQLLAATGIESLGWTAYDGGDFRIGNDDRAEAFDNEVPVNDIRLHDYLLADRPVSNSEWLGFIEAGGYDEPAYWSEDGLAWRQQSGATCPEHWRRNDAGQWFECHLAGERVLDAGRAVTGINYFEAQAFVNWLNASGRLAGARLPGEYEWEVADRSGRLERTGEVWEWCADKFHPYPGFTAFPYDNYSKPWFDGNHYSLRGGSEFTQAAIRRPSFRNFYNPDKRHIFSGLRLARDAG